MIIIDLYNEAIEITPTEIVPNYTPDDFQIEANPSWTYHSCSPHISEIWCIAYNLSQSFVYIHICLTIYEI